MPPITTDVACSVVCVTVCWHTGELCKNGWTDRDTVLGAASSGFKEPCIRWGADPAERSTTGGGIFGPLQYKLTDEWVHCALFACRRGECTFPEHAANECIRRREGDKRAMRPFTILLQTLVTCKACGTTQEYYY